MKIPNIRFNLKFYDANGNEEIVRTLDDLREKCNLSDLYDYYESGVLGRWLTSIGQAELSKQLLATKVESDLRKRIYQLLQLIGVPTEEQDVSDFIHIQQLQGVAAEDCSIQKEGRDSIPSFIVLISTLIRACESVSDQFSYPKSVADIQKTQDSYLSVIRDLLKYYEVAFVSFLHKFSSPENSTSSIRNLRRRLWFVLLLLWFNRAFREYISGYFGVKVRVGSNGTSLYFRGDWFEGFSIEMERDISRIGVDKFCDEKFGWSLEG